MSDLSLEQAIQDLEKIVVQLEQGELPLEQALEQFEKAVRLSRLSQQKLQQAEQKVSQLLQQQNGEELTPFAATPEQDEASS
ncbi:Exodeoxyribonuclease 7 small subunit [Pseudidiomarina piscicola]|uniref:Exodeoxyribonuclease 7 small subunit n=1 Tax=Pseudidiomarina piscicola TaxID=2614830 RepID=A0A6S6WNB5_9GAMM|nr:exodeoxyribonuclease VII small subunit [Pseudidiomarina piscicola]CAB0151572.1 Exodeoxyribonuclease 7 small subunit [Pseudidiomarina piscicola]VZT41037.1 Exodeoxyribonuclease 7 small subunit [Pseudomonas aeruginosa]